MKASKSNFLNERGCAVGCYKLMALDEELPLQYLDGEAPFFMEVSKLGCHKKTFIVNRFDR